MLLGHFGVGKSSLIRRFVENVFSDNYKVTIGVHVLKKEVKIAPNEKVSLIIWDLEGSEDIKNVRQSYLLGSHAFIYVFDVTRPSTYENHQEEIDFLNHNFSDVPVYLVGNKIDLVDLSATKQFLKQKKITPQYLTSAKTGSNVGKLFDFLAKELVKDVEKL